MRRGRRRRSARGAGPRPKKYEGVPLPRPPRGLPQAPHRGFGAELKLVRGWNLTLWSGVAAPPRALCELHSGPHVKKIVLRLRSKKAEISKRLWPRNRKNGKLIYSYYGLQTRYAVWRSRSHYCVVSLNTGGVLYRTGILIYCIRRKSALPQCITPPILTYGFITQQT